MFIYQEVLGFSWEDNLHTITGDLYSEPFDCGLPVIVLPDDLLFAFKEELQFGSGAFPENHYPKFIPSELELLRNTFKVYQSFRSPDDVDFDNDNLKFYIRREVKERGD